MVSIVKQARNGKDLQLQDPPESRVMGRLWGDDFPGAPGKCVASS